MTVNSCQCETAVLIFVASIACSRYRARGRGVRNDVFGAKSSRATKVRGDPGRVAGGFAVRRVADVAGMANLVHPSANPQREFPQPVRTNTQPAPPRNRLFERERRPSKNIFHEKWFQGRFRRPVIRERKFFSDSGEPWAKHLDRFIQRFHPVHPFSDSDPAYSPKSPI